MARLLDVILVVDVESTCWDGPPPEDQFSEILEIGLCPVDVASLTRLSKDSLLIKPVCSEISDFCTELTTLQPEMFAGAGSLADAAKVLRKQYQSRDRLWASWGDYDRSQFERVCQKLDVPYPFGKSHLNVKSLFATACGLSQEVGLDQACTLAGISMQGTHHRGDDDAWNIAELLCILLRNMRQPSGL